MLTTDVELDSQRDNNGVSTPLNAQETNPNMERKQLVAHPLQARTVISDNFLEENIEGQDFLTTYMNELADSMGPALETWGIFADTSVATQTGEGTGYKMANGIIAQLKTIANNSNTEAIGIADLVYRDNVGDGILNAIETYIDQDGNIKNATCVLPPQMHAKLMIEIARNRETALGDAVWQDGTTTKILGIEVTADNILRKTRNGYDKMKFTDGVFASNGTDVTNMKYGFIGQPSNIVFGMMRELDIKNQWDIDVLGYKVALLCKADVSLIWDEDTLCIPFTMNNSA